MRKRVSIPTISGKLNKFEQKASAQMPANALNLTRAVQNTTTLTIALPILFACLRNEIQPIRARACYTCVREKARNKNKASKEAYASYSSRVAKVLYTQTRTKSTSPRRQTAQNKTQQLRRYLLDILVATDTCMSCKDLRRLEKNSKINIIIRLQ